MCWTLTVVQTLMPAFSSSSTSCQRFGMARLRLSADEVRVRELVHQNDDRMTAKRAVQIELLTHDAAITHVERRKTFQSFE